MSRVYIFKDGMMEASTSKKEQAIDLIRQYQKQETHPFLRAQFSFIEGEEILVPYEPTKKPPKKTHEKER